MCCSKCYYCALFKSDLSSGIGRFLMDAQQQRCWYRVWGQPLRCKSLQWIAFETTTYPCFFLSPIYIQTCCFITHIYIYIFPGENYNSSQLAPIFFDLLCRPFLQDTAAYRGDPQNVFPHLKTPQKYQEISDIIRPSYDPDFNGRKNIGVYPDILYLDRREHNLDWREK